jgi:hypothetical protein
LYSVVYPKYLYKRHTGERRYPVINQNWMPVLVRQAHQPSPA